jgi:hypothetical protein
MLQLDSLVMEIGDGFQRSARGDGFAKDSPRALGISEDRLAEYRALMDSLGVRNLQQIRGKAVDFMVWGSGIGNTHHRGFVWLPDPKQALPSWSLTAVKPDWYIYRD